MNFILDIKAKRALSDYLKKRNWIRGGESIAKVAIPGAGNMNYVLRVQVQSRSIIIKQARDYVEKYPQVPAPRNRVEVEAAFYEQIASHKSIQNMMPQFLGLDEENSILMLEDLGDGFDFSFLYDVQEKLSLNDVVDLTNYLVLLHSIPIDDTQRNVFQNTAMRQLNYEHIFVYPFMEENGFNLDSIQVGLQDVAMKYKTDASLKAKITAIGEHYLADGDVLLHGDFYPGSWLKTFKGIKIIDTEFCFYGNSAFDLGVFIAHLHITEHDSSIIEAICDIYKVKRTIDCRLVDHFIGVEIMRRLIGLAQLPLSAMSLERKKELLAFAYEKIMKL